MSQILSNKKIGEAALRLIGSFSINHSAADPAELEESLQWLDLVVGTMAAIDRPYWLTEKTVSKALTVDQSEYDLNNFLGSDKPTDGVFFVSRVTINDGNSADEPIDIIRRNEYEEIANKVTSGKTEKIYIDRRTTPSFFVYPVMGTGATYTLKMVLQSYPPDMTANKGNAKHGIPPEWNMWMIKALVAEIGGGPVRRLPQSERSDLAADADRLYKKLMAYANREKAGTGRTARWD